MRRSIAVIFICLLAPVECCLAQYFRDQTPDSIGISAAPEPLARATTEVPLDPVAFWASEETGVYSTGMIFEDCNNDGYIDLFIANGNDMALAPNCIYLSDMGTLPTSASWYSATDEYSGHCAVGDIDDDGFVDFLVANFLGYGRFYTPNHSELYRNFTGLPEAGASWRTADSMMTFSCALGDPDGDGDLDAAFATGTAYVDVYTPDKIYFNGDGELETLPGWSSTTLRASMDVTWGDVDNDGDLDLAFCYDYEGAALFINDGGTIENSLSWQSDDHQSANTLIFGDVNDDGWLDLIVAFNSQLGGGGYFRAYFNDGLGHLNTTAGWQSESYGYGSALSLYDYDGDGDMDLAAGRWWDEPRVYENLGGTFSATPVWRAAASTVVEEMAWVDVDGSGVDGYADTIYTDGGRKLFYATRQPMHSLDSVLVDDEIVANGGYCHDLISGWISLAEAPADSIVIYYKYSASADLAVSSWSGANVIYPNTGRRVEMYADVDTGWAPLTVQFSDSSDGASGWQWDFDDGHGSPEQNPLHTYFASGAHDVSLEVVLPEGTSTRTIANMIRVWADTLVADNVSGGPGRSVEVSVRATNSFPLREIRIPVEYQGVLLLDCDSFSTVGCRTDYFHNQDLVQYDPLFFRQIVRLRTATDGSQPELPPGEGAIIKFYFTLDDEAVPDASAAIELDGFYSYVPTFIGDLSNCQPRTVAGSVRVSCCTGIRGNADGDESDEVTIDDIVYLIDWTFGGGPQPACMDEVDADDNGAINIEDLVYLVDNIFGGGPDPPECF